MGKRITSFVDDRILANVYHLSLINESFLINFMTVLKAIGRSALALTSWRDNTTGMHRSQILNQWSQLIKDNSDDIGKHFL